MPPGPDFVNLAKREGATVVNIGSTRTVRATDEFDEDEDPPTDDALADLPRRFLPPDALQLRCSNAGSGFVISEDGYILTNAHLVAHTDRATVKLVDRCELRPKLGILSLHDRRADQKRHTATSGRDWRAGRARGREWVAAVRSSFGSENRVSAGNVSALSRYLPNERLAHAPRVARLSREGKRWVYVSAGTGTWGPPVPVGTSPELTVLRFP